MNMSLKAFVYHHLYVCDEFKLDESPPPSTPNSSNNKGYTSETNSESSTLSRKWSVRLMNYLKKHEDQESSTTTASAASSVTPSVEVSEDDDEDEDYSEENQATVTLQSLGSKNNSHKNKPNTIIGLFQQDGPTTATTTTTPSQYIDHTTLNDVRRESISTTYSNSRRESSKSGSSSSSDDEDNLSQYMMEEGEYLSFGADDLSQFGDARDSDESSSGSEEDLKLSKSKKPVRSGRRGKHRLRKPSDVGPDGVSFTERRGRRYLQEKLKVYGDDQTIVVVSFFLLT